MADGNSLSIDCGKKPGIKAVSAAGMRRCRVLLGHPNRTSLDFRVLSQVEVKHRSFPRNIRLLIGNCEGKFNSR
jgi:hypothetical protein